MRYELFSLQCKDCSARNAPNEKVCAGCGGALAALRRCARCQNENPPNAYVCLTCYSILQQKPAVGFFHWRLPWGVSVVIIVTALTATSVALAKQWADYLESSQEANTAVTRYLELQRRELTTVQKQTGDESYE